MTNYEPGVYDFGHSRSGDTIAQRTLTFSGLDLTGYSANLQFRKGLGGGADIDLSIGSGLSISGNVLTIAPFSAPAVDTKTTFLYDLVLTNSSIPDQRTFLTGRLEVSPSITILPG